MKEKISRDSEWNLKLSDKEFDCRKRERLTGQGGSIYQMYFKYFFTISTQRATSKHHLKSYAPAYMHNHVANPYDEF